MAKDMSKSALCWMTGRVVSFALTNVDDIAKGKKNPRIVAMCGFDEKVLLQGMMDAIQENDIVNIVGKTSDNFDIPFIKGRCIANDVGMSDIFHSGYNFFDIDKMICPSMAGQLQHGKLDQYLMACGIEQKINTGAMVPKLFQQALEAQIEGDFETVKKIMVGIKEYNIDDAIKTAMLAWRFIKPWKKGGDDAKKK